MPLLLLILGFLFPRFFIVVLYFVTDWFGNAFDGILIPLLGFIFLPVTTLSYGVATYFFGAAWSGTGLIVMILALIVDLGLMRSGTKR